MYNNYGLFLKIKGGNAMSRKKIAIISLITVVIIAIILTSFMYFTKTKEEVATISKEYHENGWDKEIVAMIKENIPVPVGFEFVTGSKDEGFIIKNSETEKQYMWIPATELSELNDVSNLFNEEYDTYCFTEENKFKSVSQYGGFYIELADNSNELYESLKNMNEESYNATSKEVKKEYSNIASVETNLINRDELAAVLTWNSDLISSIGTTTMTLGLSISSGNDYYSNNNYYSSNYSNNYEEWDDVVSEVIDGVPIPEGFSYVEGNALNGLLIEDNRNSNLQFVWIPVGSQYNVSNIEDAREELIDYARNHDLLYDIIEEWEDCRENLPTELVRSVKEYGGFYMSVAELGYDNNGYEYNKFRGMNVVPGGLYANIGDYYRYVKPESYKTQYPAVVQKQKQGLTYSRALSLSKNLYSNNSSVVSHLTYGAEWDAAILWCINYNGLYAINSSSEERIAYVMLKDSSEIGKYKDRQVKEDGDKTGNIWNTKLLNNLWGMAGNLSELTQETYNGKIVLRGGSWANTGSDMPITSRMFLTESQVNSSTDTTIGFRTCLYIKLDGNYDYDDEWYEERCNCYYCDCDYCDTGDCDCRYCDCEEYYDENYWDNDYEERCNCYYCDCDYCDTGDCDCRYCDCEEYYDEDYWDDDYEERCNCYYCDCDYCDTGDCDCDYCDCEYYYDEDDYNNYSEVNAPQLADGMIPVRYNGSNWVVVDEDSSKWYNYENKQWANVMLSDGKYEADEVREGQVIKESEMGSMLVWIPRFAYSIESGYHTSTRGNIEVEFLQGTTNRDWNGNTYKTDYDEDNVNTIDKNTDMIVHPAFNDNGSKKEYG